jgi:predicted enzyme related to lactoylglutathione lyase
MTQKAWNPDPPDDSTDIQFHQTLTLTWQRGDVAHDYPYSVRYEVYFGADSNHVGTATTPDADGERENHEVSGLAPNTTYFWRVDTVETLEAPPYEVKTFKGDLWSFRTSDNTIYVDDSATGANDGSNWANAYRYLQYALADANAAPKPVEIRVAQGIYKPDRTTLNPRGTGDRKAAFQLINGVTLKGGYAGIGSPDPNDRNIDLYETILSGDLLGDDGPDFTDNSDNSYHVFYHPEDLNLNDTAILDGFTITAGNANSTSWHYGYGGGMYNRQSSPTVNNCTFTANSVGSYGGGVYNYKSSPTVDNCIFSENDSSSGGGMYNYEESSPTVNNCTFTANSADKNGAGMSNWKSSPDIDSCIFTENSAVYSGGGMYNNYESSPTVNNCKFTANSAVTSLGGGMYNNNGSPIVNDCTFSDNTANNGGGMYNIASSSTVNNCTFTANSAEKDGGGMHNSVSSPTVNDCTFSDNSANTGGAMYNSADSSPNLDNCTFIVNSADNGGGAICNWKSSPNLDNCTFSENAANNGGGMHNSSGSSPTVDNCTFTMNSADHDGGGMYNLDSDPNVNNCTFSESRAHSGGGMCNSGSSPSVNNCTFIANSTELSGGGMYNYSGSSPNVDNCTFTANSVGYGGGAMFNFNSSPSVNNCILTANSADEAGGAIYCRYESSPVVTNSTIMNNNAPNGPAIACHYHLQGYAGTVAMRNCIIWNGIDWLYNTDGSSITISYSDVEGGWPGPGNIDEDPSFIDLGYWDPNGTPTDPNDDFWVDGDYHLRADSPCINAGDPNFLAEPNDADMDGEKRVMLGRVDMGADEFNPFSAELVVIRRQRVGRTVFEYECEVILRNVSTFVLENVSLKMARWSVNMMMSDPNVSFEGPAIASGESVTSVDTCTFKVDRSEHVDPAEIIWHVTANLAKTGAKMRHTVSTALPTEAADFNGFKALADEWLWQGTAGEIDADAVKDGTVNLADFAKFARQWMIKGTK